MNEWKYGFEITHLMLFTDLNIAFLPTLFYQYGTNARTQWLPYISATPILITIGWLAERRDKLSVFKLIWVYKASLCKQIYVDTFVALVAPLYDKYRMRINYCKWLVNSLFRDKEEKEIETFCKHYWLAKITPI